jgi:hypothetical protein
MPLLSLMQISRSVKKWWNLLRRFIILILLTNTLNTKTVEETLDTYMLISTICYSQKTYFFDSKIDYEFTNHSDTTKTALRPPH